MLGLRSWNQDARIYREGASVEFALAQDVSDWLAGETSCELRAKVLGLVGFDLRLRVGQKPRFGPAENASEK